jgi:crossover junction endodeoxyribonuclease RuvC
LAQIDVDLSRVIAEFAPLAGSVETIFFAKDAQAAAKLGHARGVVLLNLARSGLPVFEYAPTRIKISVTGRGHADKRQVALMIRTLLSLGEAPPSDAADALAAAITHIRRAPIDERIAEAAGKLPPRPKVRNTPGSRAPGGHGSRGRTRALVGAR